uniref:Uncharacterized protein n=2 Tax=Amorphochlora amoebiformis TaxID=1561963 RepID=A0A7S0DSU1_9EUKA|mmetsp:Transcript_5264/g.7937  ORF Transcript_5264/g.7937 Transcript_5264/m.7937 type:complete len:555 (+) Transcript_5264:98-1762(+)
MRVTSENPEALICLFNAIQCGVSSNPVSNGDSDSTVLQKPSEILQYSTSGVSEGSPHEDSRVARVVSTIDHWHGEIDSNTYSVALPEICSRFLHTPSQTSLIRFLSALRPHLSQSPTLSTLLRRILPSLEILRDSKKFLRGSKEISGADSETTLYRQLAPLLVLRVLSDKAFDDGGTNEETRIRARVRVELERWVAEGVGLAVEARRLAAEILGRFPGHAGGGAALMRIESALKHRPPDHTARSQDFKQSAQGQWLARLNLSLYTLCKGLLFRPGEMLRIPGFLQRILMLSKEIFETFSTNSHQISDTLRSPSPVPSARAQASAVEGMVEVLGCCFSRTISQDKPPAPDYESLPNFPLHLLYLAITSPEESKVQPHSLRVRLGYLAGITCGIDRLRGGEIIGIFSRASEETKSPSEGCLAKVVLTRVRKILDDERETFLLPSLLQILFSLTLRASNPYPVTPAGRPPEAGPKDPKVARSIKAAVSSYVSELLQTATEVLDLLGHSAQAHSLRAALGVDVAAVRLAGALLALPGVTDVEDAGNRGSWLQVEGMCC